VLKRFICAVLFVAVSVFGVGAQSADYIVEGALLQDVNSSQSFNAKEESYIVVDEVSFPDLRLRSYISLNYDVDADGMLSPDEISGATDLSFDTPFQKKPAVLDLTGIGLLYNIKYIDLSNNRLKNADFSQLEQLEVLYVNNCGLKSLNLKSNLKLFDLKCNRNKLKKLNLKKNKSLIYISCSNNSLKTLIIENNNCLKVLKCQNNRLTKLNLRRCRRIREFNITGNPIKNFYLHKNYKKNKSA
jgi:Leucine-rich repeat (LRR) protein